MPTEQIALWGWSMVGVREQLEIKQEDQAEVVESRDFKQRDFSLKKVSQAVELWMDWRAQRGKAVKPVRRLLE